MGQQDTTLTRRLIEGSKRPKLDAMDSARLTRFTVADKHGKELDVHTDDQLDDPKLCNIPKSKFPVTVNLAISSSQLEKDIEDVHANYCKALQSLYNKYKDKL